MGHGYDGGAGTALRAYRDLHGGADTGTRVWLERGAETARTEVRRPRRQGRGGQRLAPYRKRGRRGMFFVSYANRTACAECKLKSKCTKSAFRRVLRYVDEAILDRMAERLAARPELLDARRECVEHPFGSIKQWMGQGAFLTRRLENVRGEFSITALAYNIRRAISLVGVPALIAAARA